ncbi:MAG: hypothetical protein KatS3mg074_392 [Meiothermus sp.]|uniref:Uncharacterized protein n=2 Tax=Meiothermus hypogaeus TaxID=884155 RepID=A0A511R3J7_9DEIN|nr:hypothetical protein [Meiothermus hypogaeus]RIH78050.1 hypothetical protein Mhypo_01732 [Meiothermus hypogaeus]GEM84178.1 hypothetical protein MHY01S_23440 [Meiothermus hypogaeus NBRC 106114]GIW37994.1 MAG: hypothetical protein KatS3mg074_392 [Meiothermus sp.]
MIRLLLLLGLLASWGVGQSIRVVEQRIGAQGGALQLPGIHVVIPPGALVSSVRFRLERLQAVPTSPPQNEVFFIQTLPEREVVGIYRLSSSATNFLKPLEIELRVNPPYRPGNRVIRSAIYTWDGQGYVSTQVPSTRETHTLSRLELGLGAGAGGYPAGLVLVVLRAPEENLRRECQARGGRWTGSSCERR